MKISILILALAAMTFASCKKSDQAENSPSGLKAETLQKMGADDAKKIGKPVDNSAPKNLKNGTDDSATHAKDDLNSASRKKADDAAGHTKQSTDNAPSHK